MSRICLAFVKNIESYTWDTVYHDIKEVATQYQRGCVLDPPWLNPVTQRPQNCHVISFSDSPNTENCEWLLLPDGWVLNDDIQKSRLYERMNFLRDVVRILVMHGAYVELCIGDSTYCYAECMRVCCTANEIPTTICRYSYDKFCNQEDVILEICDTLSPDKFVPIIEFRGTLTYGSEMYLRSLKDSKMILRMNRNRPSVPSIPPEPIFQYICIENGNIQLDTGEKTIQVPLSAVHVIHDFGAGYHIHFSRPFQTITCICDKSRITNGSILDFEALFTGKIERLPSRKYENR